MFKDIVTVLGFGVISYFALKVLDKLAHLWVFWRFRSRNTGNQVANVQAPQRSPAEDRAMTQAVNIVMGMTSQAKVAIEDWKKRTGKTTAECLVVYDPPVVSGDEIIWTLRVKAQDRGIIQ